MAKKTWIEKRDSVGFRGSIEDNSFFLSNEDSIYRLETLIYRFRYGTNDEVPSEFIDIQILSSNEPKKNSFDSEYDLITVYNEVFNQVEMEPIKKIANKT